MSPSLSISWRINIRNLFRCAQGEKINIEHFNTLQEFFRTALIQQNLLNIYDVLDVVLNTKDIKLSKTELSKIDLKELAGTKHRYYKLI